jgi:Flp pilus assembly protein TadD
MAGGGAERAAATRHFEEALRLRPAYPEAHNNLGGVLYLEGRRSEAIAQFTEALRLRPGFTEARNNLGVAQSAPAMTPGAPRGRTGPP